MAPRVLVLAYGNPLRSDDGVAWHVASLLQERLPADQADIVCSHQLTPEFAELVGRAAGAIFLDARESGEAGKIVQARVAAAAEGICGTHFLTPAQLMALCRELYGRTPEAYEVSVAGESFAHGEHLSCGLQDALPRIAETVIALVGQIGRGIQEQSSRDAVPL
jgi:hydrogenase maturation protease